MPNLMEDSLKKLRTKMTGNTNPIDGTSAEIMHVIAEEYKGFPIPLPYEYMPEGYPYVIPNTHMVTVCERTCTADLYGNVIRSTAMVPSEIPIVAGESYIVTLDGVEYECVAFNGAYSSTVVALGGSGKENILFNYKSADEKQPFLIGLRKDNYMLLYTNTVGSHSFTIKKYADTYVPMDARFAPEPVLTSPNGTTHKLVVSDDGVLSAEVTVL